MLAVFGDSNFSHKETIIHHEQFQNHHNVDWSRAVTINAGTSNRNRTMPREFWDAVIKMLILENLIPVIVGRGMDERWPNVEGIVDLTNQLSIGQTAHIIGKSICFVSSDTGAMHIAGSTLTPMVTIFTSVHSQFRMPWRKGVMGWNVTPMTPHLECIGCNELSHCPRNDFACVEGPAAVQPMAVVSAVLQAIDKTNLA
jgi:ADP-heptose:LPS heptosyltransferase